MNLLDSGACLLMPKCNGVDIEECSITQLQKYLSNFEFTSRDLVECYLQRIAFLNPHIKAIIETNPDALDIADKLDEERRNGDVRSLLHEIPCVVKDNISTKDKMETTAGSAALIGAVVSADAPVVALLRKAGAILLGKSNMSEFACMRASYYAEGHSSRGGQGRNPYNLSHHAGGSSSGSASAVAANMCAFSLGTETDGSIIFPADRNFVVGIKPTVGLTSTVGVIPEASGMDTVGPFARSIEDASIVLDIIQERNMGSDASGEVPTLFSLSDIFSAPFTSLLCKKEALKGAKFGMPWKKVWETISKNTNNGLEYSLLAEIIDKMGNAGAKIITVDFPSVEEIISPNGWDWNFAEGKTGSMLSEFTVVRNEFYHFLRTYLKELKENPNEINSLEDVIAYNLQHNSQEGGIPRTHPAWPTGQDTFDKCIESRNWPNEVRLKALEYIHQKSREAGIDASLHFQGEELDGLLVPIHAHGGVACSVAAKAGYPMITIPVGVDREGIPFGIGVIQTAWREDLLVNYSSAMEDLIGGGRERPQFQNLGADNYPYVGTTPESGSATH